MTVSIGLIGCGNNSRSHLRGFADFTARIRDGSRPVHTHEEGTDVLKVIRAAYLSARRKREIDL
jgi:predicted dehydrogenase